MYESFYGLRERPFNLTPDPKYLYLSEKHKEAFAHLSYGIKSRGGFVLITGEIGTGKTTISRNLLRQLDSGIEVAFIFNPLLDSIELLKKINHEFGIVSDSDSALDLTEELNAYLLNAAAHGKRCVLVIDEAQNLPIMVLEQIRLLSNLETDTEKLLQIVLIGQPELAAKLKMYELRQLNQRITARYHLKPLNAIETLQYIAYRIQVAGGRKRIGFTKSAIKKVYKLAGGVPRMINAICDRSLLIGYTRDQHIITAAVVKKAMKELRGDQIVVPKKEKSSFWRRWLPAPSLAVLFLFVVAVAWYMSGSMDRFVHELRLFNHLVSDSVTVETAQVPETGLPKVTAERRDDSVPPSAVVAADSALHLVMERLNATGTVLENESLTPLLETLDSEKTLHAALDTLIALWNRDLAAHYPQDADTDDLVAYIEEQGLDCESLSPDLAQMRALNLPGLAKMGYEDHSFWMAVVRMNERGVTLLASANKRITVSPDEFTAFYEDVYLVPWSDPSPEAAALTPGQRGASVSALKKQLRDSGRLDAENTTDAYDRETENVIRAIQNAAGLNADGKAGRQVRFALANLLPETPILTPGNGKGASPNLDEPAVAQEQQVAASPGKVSAAPKKQPSPKKTVAAPKPAAQTDLQSIALPLLSDSGLLPMDATAPLATTDGDGFPPAVKERAAEEAASPPSGPVPQTHAAESDSSEAEVSDGQALMTVRELPAIGAEPVPEIDLNPYDKGEVTAPVLGSTPLVPHEPESR